MSKDTTLFIALLVPIFLFLTCHSFALEFHKKADAMSAFSTLMSTLSIVHWVVGPVLLIVIVWTDPLVPPFSLYSVTIGLLLSHWKVITVCTIYTLLGQQYRKTARWVRLTQEETTRRRFELFVATDHR